LTRTAAALLLTLPGVPCIYTGDEIGASYLPYANPQPVNWDSDPFHLGPWYRHLISLRHRLPSLRSMEWELLEVEPRESVLAYARYDPVGEAHSLVVLNLSDLAVETVVPTPIRFCPDDAVSGLVDALGKLSPPLSDASSVTLRLPAWGAAILHQG
jgi:cyclomaltodextrinase